MARKKIDPIKMIQAKKFFAARLRGKSPKEAIAETTYKTPSAITKSAEFRILTNVFLPDDHLLARHRELLDKRDENGAPETSAVSKGLELAYKLKRHLEPETAQSNIAIQINFDPVFNQKKKNEDK